MCFPEFLSLCSTPLHAFPLTRISLFLPLILIDFVYSGGQATAKDLIQLQIRVCDIDKK